MNLMFRNRKALKDYVQKALDQIGSPMEFEKWLNEQAGKLYVAGDNEPYTASELAELV